MNKKNILILSLLCLSIALSAQNVQNANYGENEGDKQALNEGERMFEIIVREDTTLTNTRGIKWPENRTRDLLSDVVSNYRTNFAGKFTTASTSIIGLGINFIYNKLASHRQDWMQAVQKECTYTKNLSMQTEIVDFYKKPSTYGALDPENIMFEGFGCRQTIGGKQEKGGQSNDDKSEIGVSVGEPSTQGVPEKGERGLSFETKPTNEKSNTGNELNNEVKDVFYVYCTLRTDSVGQSRITNHSKFEVVVDSIYFNPYICNLPNDSTSVGMGDRIDFDFAKRSNLTLTLTAKITSSWMNEAIQVYRDVSLGEFKVTAKIDEKYLKDGVFTYSCRLDKGTEKEKNVSVMGECFIIPRSYVGTLDRKTFASAWGTGQYKIDMQVSESCSINRDFYLEKQQDEKTVNVQVANKNGDNKDTKEKVKNKKEKWNNNWKEEWNIIKKRQKSKSLWSNVKDVIVTECKGKEWVTMIIEPALTTVANSGITFISGEDTSEQSMPGGNVQR